MEEKEPIETKPENVPDNMDYIKAIKEMKENTVDKEKYEKLQKEHSQLLEAYINGEKPDIEQPKEEEKIEDLRNNLFNKELNNLDYISNALKLRDKCLENGEKDPFLPYGKNIMPTEDDIATANRVAAVFKECVEIAEGDPDVFTRELSRRTLEGVPIRRK